MAKFCTSCGAELAPNVRFCGECGAAVVSGADAARETEGQQPADDVEQSVQEPANIAPPPPPPVYAVPPAPPPQAPPPPAYTPPPAYQQPQAQMNAAPQFDPQTPPTGYDHTSMGAPYAEEIEEKSGPNWLLIGGGALFAMLLLGYYFLFLNDDVGAPAKARTEEIETKEEVKTGEVKSYFAMTQANVRDKATTVGSTVTSKIARGTEVKGKVILGEDGTSDWLELEDGSGFVGMVNLSETAPAKITKNLGDRIWKADKPIEIWSEPSATGTLIERVPAGTALTLAGLTDNDYIEIKLKKGGVGYIADGARIIALTGTKPIAIAFNPSSCGFGSEIEGLFTKLVAKTVSESEAIQKNNSLTDDQKETALANIETKSQFEKMQRNFNGLTVTGVAQHYESQSVYFAESPAQVIDVFRKQGIGIAADGNVTSAELSAGIFATGGKGKAYGKTELSCGV